MPDQDKINHLLHLADTTLILSHRNSEWCGHGPVLEQDIALTNLSLDLLGQARLLYQYAAELMGNTDEDQLAYLRTEREYKNLLLAEQPNGDWGQTILRQYFFSQFQQLLFQQLQQQPDEQLVAITAKSLKEINYHVRWSSEWVIRLGDGTDESRTRMLQAVESLWPYTGELFQPAAYEDYLNIGFKALYDTWLEKVQTVFTEATLALPEKTFMQTGGKTGTHTEHLGFILAEMQYLQRTYPNAQW
ncbi:MAG TPA: phenylacetate-CoA oxygenase subunit PaaC [Lacibacter sp.]|nr:phenylacetate-CoA oxygenase subunit PaaC [Lacibacter sp.]HMO88554.1 phenylacetate-CoA oxygenase subunit PaaC [Lacibacter sp.]